MCSSSHRFERGPSVMSWQKIWENLNLQLPTTSGLINESDLCYAGSEILVTFSSISATHHARPSESTNTHTHSVLFCMCVYCHLAIRLRDSGISQVRYITGLGPVTDYGVLKFCWAKWQTVPGIICNANRDETKQITQATAVWQQ